MATYILSVPPSVNAMYVNVTGRGRRKATAYRNWIKGELAALLAQRAKPIEGPVNVAIMLPKIRGDADNRAKPVLDLLVRAGIIPDDNAKIVRGLSITFQNESPMMRVEITAAAELARGSVMKRAGLG